MADTPKPETNPAAQAKALLDSGCNLMLTERRVVRQVRDYATKNGLSADDAQAYISYLNTGANKPAWLDQVAADGSKHADSREIFSITQLIITRDEHLAAFNANAVKHGLNPATGIAEMRRALTAADPKADQTAIGMFNAMGQIGGKPVSNHLTNLAFPEHGNAYFNGQDWQEFGMRQLDAVGTKAGELWDSVKKGATQAAGTIAGTAQTAGAQGGGAIGGFWDTIKEKASGLTFGGVAGTLGVGSLFYMIGNALSASVLGNGWISRIIGMAIGAFGAVLGFRTFGGGSGKDNEHTPRSHVEAGRGLRHDGQAAAPDMGHLRDAGRSAKANQGYTAPDDLNGDGQSTAQEIYEFDRRMRDSAARFAKENPGTFIPPAVTNPADIVIPPPLSGSRGNVRQ